MDYETIIDNLEAVQCIVSKPCTKKESECAYDGLEFIIDNLKDLLWKEGLILSKY